MSHSMCPLCGEEMSDWGNGILECDGCGSMMDSEDLDELYNEILGDW